jgi:hypothetical protein
LAKTKIMGFEILNDKLRSFNDFHEPSDNSCRNAQRMSHVGFCFGTNEDVIE